MNKLTILILCLLTFSTPILADKKAEISKKSSNSITKQTVNPNNARTLVKDSVDNIIKIIKNNKLTEAEKNAQFVALVDPVLDFNLISKLTIGKTHWPKLSADDKKRIHTAYKNYIYQFYFEKLLQYSDETISFGKAVQKGKRFQVPMTVVSGNQTYQILYKLYYKKTFQIYDLEIEGVSIVKTYNAQFAPYLKRQKVDDLIKLLR